MSKPQKQERHSPMLAGSYTPWVAVSLLAEHIFCPRAAIIQHEANMEDTGEEPMWASQGRKKRYYSIAAIKRDLRNWASGMGVAVLVTLILWAVTADSGAAPCVVSLGLLVSAIVAGGFLNIYFVHYLPAVRAAACVPNPNHTESQAVNWWGFLNAGFVSRRLGEGLRDSKWRLVGQPWRVLVKGDLRIPVFRKRFRRDSATAEKLYRQHYARMAAYCHLLEVCEGAKSPYGVVLFGDSHKGVTVPNQPGSRKTFHTGLLELRDTLSNYKHRTPPPADLRRCKACPHSWRDRQTGTSVCGQRFNWRPPNIKSDEFDRRW